MAEIKIDINLESERAKKELERFRNFMETSGDQMADSERSNLEKMMTNITKYANQADSNMRKLQETTSKIKLSENLTKQLRFAEQNVAVLNDRVSQMRFFDKDAHTELEIAKDRLESIKNELNEIDVGKLEVEAEKFNQALLTSEQRLLGAETGANKIVEKFREANFEATSTTSPVNQISSRLFHSSTQAEKLSKGVADTSRNLSQATKASGKLNKTFDSGIKKLGRYALALFSIRTASTMLSRLGRSWLNSNDEGAKQVQANITAITNALSQLLAPVITFIANTLGYIVGYANAILKAFFGIDLFAKSTAKNVDKGVGGGLKKANKELKKFTAGFDEAEVVSSNISENLGGAGGGGGLDEIVTPKIPEPDVSGFLNAIDKIKGVIDSVWNSEGFQKYMNDIKRIAVAEFEFIKSISANLWDNVVETWYVMLPNLQEGFNTMVTLVGQMTSDLADTVEKWLPVIGDSINSFVDEVYATFRPMYKIISEMWRDVWQIALDLWNEYGADILDSIGEAIDNTIDLFKKIWTHVINPILEPAIEYLSELWHDHLKDLVIELGSFLAELIRVGLEVYNKFVKPIASFLLDILQPTFSVVFGTILGVVKGVFGGIVDFITISIRTLRGILNGLITFVTGVFTGNWKKAWQGVRNIFSSIMSGLGNIFKIPINAIIDGINGFIRGLNRIKIPKWVPSVGGKGINIAQIPRLAEGAVLTQPTLNIAGEYPNARRNPEIVTPESKMREAMEDVLSRFGGTGTGKIVIQNVLDGRIVSESVVDVQEKQKLQLNGGVL